jgi:TPR repeat protein
MRIVQALASAVIMTAATTAMAALADAEAAYHAGRYADALALLEQSALAGDVEAQEAAGMMHLLGSAVHGAQVATDPVRAAHWFNAAAGNGSTAAQFALSRMVALGIGEQPDFGRAAALAAPLDVLPVVDLSPLAGAAR